MTGKAAPDYPEFSEITLDIRPLLHPMFKRLMEGISEFTFANIYLFRETHNYKISILENLFIISGTDKEGSFFMLPSGLPGKKSLDELFEKFSFMKSASEKQAQALSGTGFKATPDRDNFDYLYLRSEMAGLAGRRFHRKKNLINFFIGKYSCDGKPLVEANIKDAFWILEEWRKGRDTAGDYPAAKEALKKFTELELCGAIYYVEGKPAAYALGEELNPRTFVMHFEKGVGEYKGLLQYVNRSFAMTLPEKYEFMNREQDLGDAGLRKSKMSYRPSGFIKKFRIIKG